MENKDEAGNSMENIFYAALALHVAGKPISKDNIRIVLKAAGSEVDEPALDMMAAFMESLKASGAKNGTVNDPRVIKLLTTALSQQKMQVEQLQVLLNELSTCSAPEVKAGPPVPVRKIKVTGGKPAAEAVHPVTPDRPAVARESARPPALPGRYVYGITGAARDLKLGPVGLDGSEVYTITCGDLGAIVHDCPLKPYRSLDDQRVKGWVKTHQNVLDLAREHFDVIIPLGFDTIIKPGDGSDSPNQVVRDWLKSENQRFRSVISRIEGKDEYAVQISYIPSEISRHLPESSPEVRRIKEAMAGKSSGVVYIYQQKLERALKADMEKLADKWFADFYERIKQQVDDVILEKNRKVDDNLVMLLNLSCLVAEDKVLGLGAELENIENMEGFSVHFSGPWPPYSFVSRPMAAEGKKDSNATN